MYYRCPWSDQLRLPLDLQHGSEPTEGGGGEPGVHDGEKLSSVPKLFNYSTGQQINK